LRQEDPAVPLITWNDSLSVKHESIDVEHQQLVALINQLHEAMSKGKGREAIGRVLSGLLEYTRTHFVAEEHIMVANAYPGYRQQKAAHDEFVQKVVDLRTRLLGGESVVTIEVMKFIKEWLTDHIQGMDRELGAYLNGKVDGP
jgi:hemerythrin